MSKKLIPTSIFALISVVAQAEQVWVPDGGIQRFFAGTKIIADNTFFEGTEVTANYSINFNEDAKYVFGFSVNYGGASYMTNTTEIMFGLGGKEYSLVVGKSANAILCLSEIQGGCFVASSAYTPPYAFTSQEYAKLPNVTVLGAEAPRPGVYTYEITLTTSSSGAGKVSVEIPELRKQYEYDLKLAGEVATSLIGLRLSGINPSYTDQKQYTASIADGIFARKYVLPKSDVNVPEPSYFGVFSGVVALTCVVIRRRRKEFR